MDKKTWLITGVSSGLGKAIAEKVIESGDFMIGTFRSRDQVNAFNHQGIKNAKAIMLDITDENTIDTQVKAIVKEHRKIDVLVNNAGVGFIGAIEEASMAEIRNVFEANFFGTLKMTQAVLPSMRKNRIGHIVQISSHGGIKAFAGFGVYNASKFALEGFSEALAQELDPLGIKLSIIEPGPFRTNFAGTGLQEAKQTINDYTETAGVFREKLKSVNGLQEGDPKKAASAIYAHVSQSAPTLRLPLGKTALMTIDLKLESVKHDLETNRDIAVNSIFV